MIRYPAYTRTKEVFFRIKNIEWQEKLGEVRMRDVAKGKK